MSRTTLSIQFESYLRQVAAMIRSEFAKRDESYMKFAVECSGRPDGDLEIKFTIGSHYGETEVSGGDLDACLEEFFRRKGWERRFAPLCLAAGGGAMTPPSPPSQDDTAALVERLKRYVRHSDHCAQNRWPKKGPFLPCDCGLDKVLAALNQANKEQEG